MLSKSKLTFFALFFLSSFALLPSAFAHFDHGQCKADYDKFCAGTAEGGGFQCLKSHEKDLSPDCQAKFTMMKERHEAFEKACGNNVKKLCAGTEQGRGKWECIRQNQDKLSSACQAQINARASARPDTK